MNSSYPNVAIAGREAAHLLRIVAIARDRCQALLPSLAATTVEGQPGSRRVLRILAGASEEDLLDRLGAALARGVDSPAAAMLAALRRAGLPAHGLRDLAAWLAERATCRHDLFRAVSYPFTLMITGALVYSVAFHGFVMPVLMAAFGEMFAGLGASLPLLTAAFVNFYAVFGSWWASPLSAVLYVLAVLALGALFLRWGSRFTHYRLSLAIPFAGQYLRFEAARTFCRTLGLLLEMAVPLPEAIRLAAEAVASPVIRRRLAAVADRVAAGEAFGECIRAERLLPPSVSWRLWSAYYRSTFATDLDEIATSAGRELAAWELRVVGAFKLVMVGVAAVVLSPVALAVVAMYLPMFSLISSIG